MKINVEAITKRARNFKYEFIRFQFFIILDL